MASMFIKCNPGLDSMPGTATRSLPFGDVPLHAMATAAPFLCLEISERGLIFVEFSVAMVFMLALRIAPLRPRHHKGGVGGQTPPLKSHGGVCQSCIRCPWPLSNETLATPTCTPSPPDPACPRRGGWGPQLN